MLVKINGGCYKTVCVCYALSERYRLKRVNKSALVVNQALAVHFFNCTSYLSLGKSDRYIIVAYLCEGQTVQQCQRVLDSVLIHKNEISDIAAVLIGELLKVIREIVSRSFKPL